jgi:signal transduction histidine kinase
MLSSSSSTNPEEFMSRLIHDLRQPIGNIGLSAFYIDLLLGDPGGKVQEQLRAIQAQVERASLVLSEAARELGRLSPQALGAESLEPTNRATSAVT